MIVRGVALGTVLLAAPAAAHAQLCHELPEPGAHAARATDGADGHHHDGARQPASAGPKVYLALGVQALAATTTVDAQPASYQGLAVIGHLHWWRLHVQVDLPTYRLRDGDGAREGLGDVGVAPWLALVERPQVMAGVGVPIGLPTGSADDGLGMGHVMVMPGVYGAVRRGALDLTGLVTYHRKLGGTDHSHHGGHGRATGPIVEPMSAEEVGLAGRLGARLTPAVRAFADASVAVPTEGERRALAGVGLAWQVGRTRLEARVDRGVTGRPVGSRGVVGVRVDL
ncbi:MAG: hypothetical protein R2939_06880 [Kofleriaceae bacterium]